MNIFEEIKNRAINYKEVIDSCETNFARTYDKIDISIIVPVYGRTEFNKVLCDHFKRAIFLENHTDRSRYLTITLTIVEHSDSPQHRKLCDHWVNYVWIPKKGGPFNKCLAHNVGVLLTKNANYFLFHDVDILVPEDYFDKLLKNFSGFDALQTFTKRRLQHCDQWLTNELMQGCITMNEIHGYPGHYHPAQPGAMGGSIFLTNELFFKTTFCAPFFDQYGLEDAFFWQCINLMGKMGCCDQPGIELYHLYHYADRTTKPIDWQVYNAFLGLPDEEKKRFINLMANNVNKYCYETEDKNI